MGKIQNGANFQASQRNQEIIPLVKDTSVALMFCLLVCLYLLTTYLHKKNLLLNMLFSGSKPVSHHNDYRPDPTGVRGGIPQGGVGGVGAADRIRAEHNGRNGNGLQQRTGNAASATPVASSNSPAHLSAALAAAAGAPAGTLILICYI